ncbi:ACT11D09.5 [Cucumis melo var. makuwa]|uniref:ACT11D09.5 n=1 Tax=Cucumis melo var. makuwa TaxID=1194695 RepID=A0A5A7T6H2_CUCMM|nr:ACT11D09.5 [Cucumis melo var. makuwa]TYK13916.1 ACT11D09.5 [Cucumis melo var. makuwa]
MVPILSNGRRKGLKAHIGILGRISLLSSRLLSVYLFFCEGWCSFREGRRDARVWSPNPSQGYMCKSLFSLLLDPSPPRESIFDVVWKTKGERNDQVFRGKERDHMRFGP